MSVIRYIPKGGDGIRPEFVSAHHVSTLHVVDDRTGWKLFSTWRSVLLPGERYHLPIWRVDRAAAGLPSLFFVTRDISELVSQPTAHWRDRQVSQLVGREIVHCHEDGFFPFRDALYTSDLSFERISAMLDIKDTTKGEPRGLFYDDNRDLYREQAAIGQRQRMASAFTPANFETDPMSTPGAVLYLPERDSATYDAPSGTATARDGSKLTAVDQTWWIGMDRNGYPHLLEASWTSADGRVTVPLTLAPHRAWRDGYGETRAVGISLSSASAATDVHEPSGETLAALVNVLVEIAGEHAGHMVVVDHRGGRGS